MKPSQQQTHTLLRQGLPRVLPMFEFECGLVRGLNVRVLLAMRLQR